MPIARRDVLLLGGGVLTLGAAGIASQKLPDRRAVMPKASVRDWIAKRRPPYFIGHRGAGGVVPEHSLEGYVFAIEAGMPAIEVSVVVSSDGVLYCHHDTEFDRTTTLTGPVELAPSTIVDNGRINIPRLGPRWGGENMPMIPRLDRVLLQVAGRAVVCLEAKDGRAFAPMLALLESAGIRDGVIIKAPVGSSNLDEAKQDGYPLFAYLGAPEDVTERNLVAARSVLDPETDSLVLPTRDKGAYLPDELVRSAVATKIPVWTYSTHRRCEVEHYSRLGVEGFVITTPGYASTKDPRQDTDSWATGTMEPGVLTRDPYSDSWAVNWSVKDAIAVDSAFSDVWVTLGNVAPLVDDYTVRLQVNSPVLTRDPGRGVAFIVGAPTDASPQVDGTGMGYLLSVSYTGTMTISTMGEDGSPSEQPLAKTKLKNRPREDEWIDVAITVSPDSVDFTWDGSTIRTTDRRWRGGYFHVGRLGEYGLVAFRHLQVTRSQ